MALLQTTIIKLGYLNRREAQYNMGIVNSQIKLSESGQALGL